MGLSVALATEDELSEAVGKRLLAEIERFTEADLLLLRRNGSGYLRSRMSNWRQLAQHQPVVLLTDLDRVACPGSLLDDWFGTLGRPDNFVCRVAVREIESWLLADHDAIRLLIGKKGRLPAEPDELLDPKQHLLTLAKQASRAVRHDLLKEAGAVAGQGIGYNAHLSAFVKQSWCPERASQRSPSLRKARIRLQELGERMALQAKA